MQIYVRAYVSPLGPGLFAPNLIDYPPGPVHKLPTDSAPRCRSHFRGQHSFPNDPKVKATDKALAPAAERARA